MRLYILLVVLLTTAFGVQASEPPLPRYASVKSDEANIRNGPGLRYPVRYVIVRKAMPVEVIAEFENWRKVKDIDGEEGWVHRSMLSSDRTVVILNGTQALHEDAEANSQTVAYAEQGVVAELVECKEEWCKVRVGGEKGFIHRRNLWGVYGDEKF